MNQEALEAAVSVSSKATYGGAASAIVFGLTANELAAYGGLIVAILGFLVNSVVNWYYKHKTYKLEEKRLERLG